jgi:5-methylcytosine-specific restriction endonuclease McrA
MCSTWTDDRGKTYKVPRQGILSPTRAYGDRALRRFVLVRDAFTCRLCGAHSVVDPATYTGRYAPQADNDEPLVLDHVVPRCAGGTNHPDNLQTLCEICNHRKGGEQWPAPD